MTKDKVPFSKIITIEIWEHKLGTKIVNFGDEDVIFSHITEGKRTPKDFLSVGAKQQVFLEYKVKDKLFIRIK